jgi:large subunit ribosomal protein L18
VRVTIEESVMAIIQCPWVRLEGRARRHLRIRKKICGTAERPRLSVRRSLKHIYAQLIDDIKGATLIFVSSKSPALKDKLKTGGDVKAAALVGEFLAQAAVAKGLAKVVFDRGGYKYHGRVKALAEAARKNGLIF